MRSDLEVVHADRSMDRTLRYLLEFYFHDLAQWFKFDQQPDGNYTDSSDDYWEQDNDVYLLNVRGVPVGFGITGSADEWLPGSGARDMTEFFLVRRHRRTGMAGEFAATVWGLHPGPWLVRVFHPNLPALPFWRTTISRYSAGLYDEKPVQKNGKDWSHFTFESRGDRQIDESNS